MLHGWTRDEVTLDKITELLKDVVNINVERSVMMVRSVERVRVTLEDL